MSYRVAILGATGLVGRTMLEILAERNFPVLELVPLASARSVGETVEFRGEDIPVRLAEPDAFKGIDIVLASAGGDVSKALLPAAAAHGAVSIDNTSAYRYDDDVPLVVPEINPHRIGDYGQKRIIANPNCSTIQLVLALKPLHDLATVERVHVATYQSVSGAGKLAVEDLAEETRAVFTQLPYERQKVPHQIAFNAIPQIDVFRDDGDTKEEWKMRVETPKIMEAPIRLHATCVRVPVFYGHSESVWIETAEPITVEAARAALAAQPGVRVVDDPNDPDHPYPMPIVAAGHDETFVGRIRRDPTCENGLAFWVVADNIRKGAALNAVQIAEKLVALWQAEGKR